VEKILRSCEFCNKTEEEGFYIYVLIVETNKQVAYIGLNKVVEGLAEWITDKYYHLSASQIILFRPDIVKEYLQGLYNEEEKVESFYFQKYQICTKCFETYKEIMPLM